MLTRRDWITGVGATAASAGLVGCGRKRSPRYQGLALVANQVSRSLAVINLSNFRLLTTLVLEFTPTWIFAAPNAQHAFLLSADSLNMMVFNLDTLHFEKRIALGGKPTAACLDRENACLWISLERPETLLEISTDDARRGFVRARLPVKVSSIDARNGRVALVFPQERKLAVYHVAARRLNITPQLSSTPDIVVFRQDGKTALIANTAARTLTAIDCERMRSLVELPLPISPEHLCFNQDGGQLFVTGPGMDAVVIVSPYQTEIAETILAGSAPGNMATTSTNPQYLFVVNPGSGDVTVIQIDNRRVLARIPVGQKPGAVLLTPDDEYALVLNESSGDVAVIRLRNIRQANLFSRKSRTAPLFTMIPVGSGPIAAVVTPRTA